MHRRLQCLPKTYKFTKLIVTPQIQFQSLETSSEEEEFKDKTMANQAVAVLHSARRREEEDLKTN